MSRHEPNMKCLEWRMVCHELNIEWHEDFMTGNADRLIDLPKKERKI